MKKLLLFLFFLSLSAVAQKTNGTVFSLKDNLPLENTNIFALSSKSGSVTNSKGEFSIHLGAKFKDEEILEFSHIGYVTQTYSLSYLAKNNYKVFLEEKVENLSGVIISSNHKLQLKLSFNKINSLKHPVFGFGSFIKDDIIYMTGGDPFPNINWLEKYRSERADFQLPDFINGNQNTFAKPHYKRFLTTYNIKTNTLEISKLRLEARAYHNIHFYDNSIYVLGGKKILVNKISSWEYLQDQIEVLNLSTQTIATDKTNPHQAANFASFSYKDNILVLGGSVSANENGDKNFSNKVHLYNITSGYWYELPNMLTAKETAGILIGDKIYLIGGNEGKLSTQIESFDLITEKWQPEAEIFTGLERPAIAHHDDVIYFFEDGKMYTYDLKLKLLKEYEIDLPLKFSAMYYSDEKLYILGGRVDNSYSQIPSGKIFTVSTKEFKLTKPLKTKSFSEINISKSNG